MNLERDIELLMLPGYRVSDNPRLALLVQSATLLTTFIGLFRGTDGDVILRLYALTIMSERGEATRWTPAALQSALGFLDATKIDTTMRRIRDVGLVTYDPVDDSYTLTVPAYVVLTAWASAATFMDERFGEIAFLNAQIAGGNETLGVPDEILNLALARTRDLHSEIDGALTTGSTVAIQNARDSMREVFRWAVQGVELLGRIAPDEGIGAQRRDAARRLAGAQSRMLRLGPALDRALHQMESQRVHLGNTGISSNDVQSWLRHQSVDDLIRVITLSAAPYRPSAFLVGDVVLDVAEELVGSERPKNLGLPAQQQVAESPLELPAIDTERLERFIERLAEIDSEEGISVFIEDLPFDEAGYRLSLLPLFGERGDLLVNDPAAPIADLPLEVVVTDAMVPVGTGDVASVSSGQLRRIKE
jgi:hypothetical protein